MADKNDIGKGIRALLQNSGAGKKTESKSTTEDTGQNILEISITAIEPNPFQPRDTFIDEALEELAESIRVHGIIQPITVRRLHENAYQIISGERRYRASKLAGLKNMPAYIMEADDQEMLEMALVENIQREDLNPVEIAISYQRLIEECDLTHEDLSERLGKNRSTITNYIRLLKLPPQIQESLKENKLTMGHARALAGLKDVDVQLYIFNDVLARDLSVRATEELVKDFSRDPARKKASNPKIDQQIKNLEESLSTYFNTIVKIKRSSTGSGSIVLRFKNDEEFNDILDMLDN